MAVSATLPTKKKVQAPPKLPAYSEHEVLASLCRQSFADFVKEFWHVIVPEQLVWNWHMEFLCNQLQEMAERVIAGKKKKHDLIINISPGTSKSLLSSIMLPVWCWTRMPSMRIITASYAYSLATYNSGKSRDLIKSDLFKQTFPTIQIRDDQDAKGNYMNTAGGERYAIGTGGAVTGKHAHMIIVDDPLDPNGAASEADLASANRWLEETIPSRKIDKAVTPIILIMQRLHEFDPTGSRLAKADKIPVHWICLPAQLTEDVHPPECREFYVDGFMDPIRLGEQALLEAEAQGEYPFNAQYLQRPVPRGGLMFHPDRIEKGKPDRIIKEVRYWDKAGSTTKGSAYTVGALLGLDSKGRFWILDIVRGQWNSGLREQTMKKVADKDTKRVIIYVEQEPGSGGKQSAEGSIRGLAGFRVRADKVGKSDGDKEARADAFSAQVNIGNVSMVEAHWNADFIKELRFFPRSRLKDQVDAASGAFNCLAVPKVTVGGRRVLDAYSSSN